MDWDLVQLFIEVVDAGSMSEAARRRGITRSAVSQRLKLLERQTNSQLLRRTTRELAPTDIGHTLYEHGRRIALQFEAARFDVAASTRKLSGLVRISVPFGLGVKFITPILQRFVHDHPDVTLRVVFGNRFGNLIEAEIDIAIKVSNQLPEELVAREVCELRWYFYCTPRYRQQLGRCETVRDLSPVAFLSPHEGRKVEIEVLSLSGVESIVLTPRVSSENILFLLDCALDDMGVALLPEYLVKDAISTGRLVRLLPGYHSKKNGGKLFILTVPNRYPTPAAQALIKMMRQDLPGLLAEATDPGSADIEGPSRPASSPLK